jgi:hypothetical protein
MPVSDEMTGAITTTEHNRDRMLDPTLNLIQLGERVIEVTAHQQLELLIARQHHRHRHASHAHIMRMGL